MFKNLLNIVFLYAGRYLLLLNYPDLLNVIDVVDSDKDITEGDNDIEVASAQTGIVKDQVWR